RLHRAVPGHLSRQVLGRGTGPLPPPRPLPPVAPQRHHEGRLLRRMRRQRARRGRARAASDPARAWRVGGLGHRASLPHPHPHPPRYLPDSVPVRKGTRVMACDHAPRWWSSAHHFATADVETELIPQGIHAISTIRDRVEREEHTPLPIVWFVRFQRTWTEYVKVASPRYFAGAFGDVFDGFALAKPELRRLQARGDEIGCHYHAYNYVHRDDLSHQQKIAIWRPALTACQAEIARRHAELEIHTFRFGWFFVPDYALFRTLRDGRI